MNTLIDATEKFVVTFLNKNLDASFVYHNLTHTQRVVEKANELADLSGINDIQKNILLIASWFHDTGYTKDIKNHEAESVIIATDFLKQQKVSETDITLVCDLILATKMNAKPNNKLEKI